VHLVGFYNAVADNTGIFIRLAVVASQICEILRNSVKIRTYSSSKVIQGHRSWCQSKAQLVTSDVKSSRLKWPRGQNFGLGLEALVSASASNI